MPAAREKEVRRRGGAKRYRSVRIGRDKFLTVAVVPKAGPRGGHTVPLGPARSKRIKKAAKGRKRSSK